MVGCGVLLFVFLFNVPTVNLLTWMRTCTILLHVHAHVHSLYIQCILVLNECGGVTSQIVLTWYNGVIVVLQHDNNVKVDELPMKPMKRINVKICAHAKSITFCMSIELRLSPFLSLSSLPPSLPPSLYPPLPLLLSLSSLL